MSLKGVELQIAIPKTVDAGKIAEQHQQNVVQQQYHANDALNREIERKQLTVNDTEKISEVSDNNEKKAREKTKIKTKKNARISRNIRKRNIHIKEILLI